MWISIKVYQALSINIILVNIYNACCSLNKNENDFINLKATAQITVYKLPSCGGSLFRGKMHDNFGWKNEANS